VRFEDLDVEHMGALASLCGGCVYWEFPAAFDKGTRGADALSMKSKWLCCHRDRGPLGRVALTDGGAIGFIQFGPPELYPRCGEYPSGPVGEGDLFIACLFVKPEERRHGLARLLLGDALTVARAGGQTGVATFTRRGSDNNPSGPLALYERCGFGVVRDGSEFPLVGLSVRKELVLGAVPPN